ncbi:MAG: IPT/TIG domain-containing protein [Patescibacteria group bacterium]|jgi:cysteine-rich repeat protein
MKLRYIFAALAVSTLVFAGGVFAQPANAQLNTGLDQVGQTIKLSNTDPRTIAVNIINALLGLLGIIMLGLILYAGFLWMTSGGDATKVENAQKIIRNAVIGLVIILSAWAIAYYVINALLNATGNGGTGGGGGGSGGTGGGGIGTTANRAFRVVSATPQGDDTAPYNKNSKINITFSQEISPDVSKNWQSYIKVSTDAGADVPGTWELVGTNGQWVRFTPGDACPEDQNQKCFAKNTLFKVTIDRSKLKSSTQELISCGGLYPSCDFKFFIGDKMDTQAPRVTITNVYDYQASCQNVPYINIPAIAVDDYGISIMQWLEDGVAWDSDGPSVQPSPKTISSSKDWSTVGKVLKQPYEITVNATDMDSNIGSRSVHLTVLDNHCCNQKQDGDETGIDCGGNDCLSCAGGACSGNGQCAGGSCQNGVCVEQPIITNIDPTDGKAGTFVSIWGAHFGDSGTVTFLGPPAVQAVAPQACTASGAKTWSDGHILVEVPQGAAPGPIEVFNATSKLLDRTDADPGPVLPNFEVNDIEKPGVCSIDPQTGMSGIQVKLSGAGFGGVQGDRTVGFGPQTLITQTNWGAGAITFSVPNLYAGRYGVGIKDKVGNPLSNSIPFDLQTLPPEIAPSISAITPDNGPTGQYLTIVGQHFGSQQGLVKFVDKATNVEIAGDTNFPAACGSGMWTDSQIVIKVPTMVVNGQVINPVNPGSNPNFQVYIIRNSDVNKESNKVDFLFSNAALGPGICKINPTSGPTKTVVSIFGERFGANRQPNDKVIFSSNKEATTYNNWNDEQIDVAVPDGAVTGKMFVQPANPPDSNAVQFLIGDCRDDANVCKAGQLCCPGGTCADDKCPETSFQAMYAWEMTTGIIPRTPSVIQNCRLNPQPGDLVPPSPSPWEKWPGGQAVCTGQAKMGVMFDMPIEQSAAELPGVFKLMKCTGSGVDPCTDRTKIDLTGFAKQTNHLNQNPLCSQPPATPDCQDYITFEPKDKLDINSTYEVYVSANIKSLGQYGDVMTENKSCNEPGSGYCYRFKTRGDDSACQVGYVYMSPATSAVQGLETQDYQAVPVAKDAVCSLLSCNGLDWQWSTTWGPDNLLTNLASIVTPIKTQVYQGQPHVSCSQAVKAGEDEATNPPVHVVAQEQMSSIKGIGELSIKYLDPKVIDYAPNCDTACLNAYVWARFNTTLKPSTINAQNVEVYECPNENCLESDLIGRPNLSATYNFKLTLWPGSDDGDQKANSYILIDARDYKTNPNNSNPPNVLKENSFYEVRLKGGAPDAISSSHGRLLQKDFSWKFRTAAGEKAYCKPDKISVTPAKAIEKSIGDRRMFQSSVKSSPDDCRADGQMLYVTDDFVWSFIDANQQVAKYAPFPPTTPPKDIDADGVLPSGCDSSCKATGADGVYGLSAKCGNGIVETTDKVYCNSDSKITLAGQPCLIMPLESKAGEECDGSLADGQAAKCDPNTCLWLNTLVVPDGTCGDFTVNLNKGEMCDPGLRCFDTKEGSNIVSGVPCNAPGQPLNVSKTDCEAQGGKCEVRNYNGCSLGCKNLGAYSVEGSDCGNGSLGYGEDCDQGSNNGFSGCSATCKHVGSSKSSNALCGNGILEPGENCEAPEKGMAIPAYCDKQKCLKLGNQDFGSGQSQCGDLIVDGGKGEDCDDGNHVNGDGCNAVCLREGSNWKYPGNSASLCGNGIIETGERCENKAPSNAVAATLVSPSTNPPTITSYGSGNGLIDPMQIGEIVGAGEPDADKIKKTQLSVAYQNIKAEATFGVQCGNVQESDCSQTNQVGAQGLDKDGCCNLRPKMVQTFPVAKSSDVCRNTLIAVTFDKAMDANSVLNNFILAKEINAAACPEGTVQLNEVKSVAKGFWPWLKTAVQSLFAWVQGKPAYANVWCAKMVAGNLSASTDSKRFDYTLEDALDANTNYVVRFNGDPDLTDNSDLSKRVGIKSKDGVVVIQDVGSDENQWQYSWRFTTGNDICRMSGILVEDLNDDHPTYFQKANEQHDFRATALALHNGKTEKISPVQQYSWNWWGWLSNAEKVAKIVDNSFTTQGSVSQAQVAAQNINGSSIIYAGIQITSDTIDGSEALAKPQIVFGALPIMVLLCENPWPELTQAPFRDQADSPTLAGTIFEKSNLFFNFQTMYCRDNGQALLPELETHPIPSSSIDQYQGILRQYLFAFKDPTFKHDGIGIRIMTNTYHDTLMEWYKQRQKFSGSPQTITIDGYEVLQDDNTTYIGFANTEGADANIYQNILVISHNADAAPETVSVYDQLVKNFAFNINLKNDNSNVCIDADHLPVAYQYDGKTTPNGINLVKGKSISCAADWDCTIAAGAGSLCASYKFKLQRDLIRLQDFRLMASSLKSYYSQKSYYPKLAEGTFLSGETNSRWPSWNETFAKELGLSSLPADPVNRFVSCGFCKRTSDGVQTSMPCTVAQDCPSGDYTCEADNGLDPQTCWNVKDMKFKCPSDDSLSPSEFYLYNAYEDGRRFEFGANFEIPPPHLNDLYNWWYPAYEPTIKVCYTTSTISDGRNCNSDDDCKPCSNPLDVNNCQITKGPAGACRVLGTFKYNNICDDSTYAASGTCGDGIVNQGEICELGQTRPASCSLSGGIKGTKLQVCQSCTQWVDDPKVSSCHENAVCGNGRIDKTCDLGGKKGLTCSFDADCADDKVHAHCNLALVGSPAHTETCDDGVLNGTYGHCNSSCTGVDKFCGNGKLDPGETCDRGSGPAGNGVWCEKVTEGGCYDYLGLSGIYYPNSCSADCQRKAPYCGDGQVYSGLEQCDGNVLYSTSALCKDGDLDKLDQPCVTDADCGTSGNGSCGHGPGFIDCAQIKVGRCATAAKICANSWELTDGGFFLNPNNTKSNYQICYTDADCIGGKKCLPLSQAGGESGGCSVNKPDQCSTTKDAGACIQYDTAHIRKCDAPGSSNQCKYNPWSACLPMHSCGDGVIDQGEECDDGNANASFNACTSTCKKNVCGDGHLQLNVEECDNGQDNGKKVCKADYQSTCNDCSLQCRNVTASGGYCGNSVKESGEQCDGNKDISTVYYSSGDIYILSSELTDAMSPIKDYVGTQCTNPPCKIMKEDPAVTCKQLGYDFAVNSDFNYVIKVLDWVEVGKYTPKAVSDALQSGKNVNYNLSLIQFKTGGYNINESSLLTKLFLDCGVMRLTEDDVGVYQTDWNSSFDFPTLSAYWSCAKAVAKTHSAAIEVKGQVNDKPYCANNCQLTGCGRCIEEGGDGKIVGTVYVHGGTGGLTVAGARVTLLYNGLNVTQVFTDENGRYEFSGLNNRSECGGYSLVAETFNPVYDTVKSAQFSFANYESKVTAEVCDDVDYCELYKSGLVFPDIAAGKQQ